MKMLGDDWAIVPFGKLVENKDSKRVPLKESDRTERHGAYPYYGASGIIDYVNDYLYEGTHLLIGEDGANLLAGATPIAFLADGKFWVNNHAHVLAATDRAELKYLQYFFETLDLKPYVTGSAQPKLTRKSLDRIPVPLPPIAEQRRIAAILDRADAVRRKRQEAIALTDELLRSAFLEMFGEPVRNLKSWKVMPMHEVIQKIEAGWSANGEDRRRKEDEWGVLKISAVTSGYFQASENKAVENPSFKKPPIVPQRGDLLFSRANTRELVAATCLVENDCECLFLPDKLWRIKTYPKIANVEYLRFLLADPEYRSLLVAKAIGTSGSVLNVSQAKLLEMDAPIPDLNVQERFAEILWQTFELRKQHELACEESNSAFNSLLQRTFRGEL